MFRKSRDYCNERLEELKRNLQERKLQRDIEEQRRMNEEKNKFQQQHIKEMEETILKQQQAEEWFMRKLQLKEAHGSGTENVSTKNTQQTLKLLRYTISPFAGDYKVWL